MLTGNDVTVENVEVELEAAEQAWREKKAMTIATLAKKHREERQAALTALRVTFQAKRKELRALLAVLEREAADEKPG
jgi:hypothetical protein